MKQEATQVKDDSAKRQTFSGVVVSDKMKDTAVIVIDRYVKHPKYHKYMNRRTKIMADDPGNTKKIGDKAVIEACRPISKRKAFKVIR
ncbi:MAG: small subunit ribosomal protein [Candidatus Parcubacteria bacterium]|jgi:small subunit ribosomal protein S17|nr:small subunit ribosomal protein [Candidatus Parcubacteria bacterium]